MALAGVGLGIAAALAGGSWLLADDVAAQFGQLVHDVPRAFGNLTERLAQYPLGRLLLSWVPESGAVSLPALGRATGILSTTLGTTLGVLANVIVVAFIALYVAVDPGIYVRGVLRLVPVRKRTRACEVLDVLGHTLRRWLAGKLIGMAVIGVLTGGGLWMIGVPLALALGLLAGLLNFIPYLGPLLSFVLAVLLALTDSGATAAWVLGLYAIVQFLESYLLTPLVDRQSVALPPALTIVAQVTLVALVGTLGLLLASPLTAALLVLVRMLYVEGILGDTARAPLK